jgi:hypothetical protein
VKIVFIVFTLDEIYVNKICSRTVTSQRSQRICGRASQRSGLGAARCENRKAASASPEDLSVVAI